MKHARRLVRKILLAVLTAIALLLLVSLFLPGRYRVQRSIVINAKTEAIFPLISTPRRWPEWSAWSAEQFPNLKYSYDGPESGVGAISRWTDPKIGDGEMRIRRADPAKGVWYDLTTQHGAYTSSGAVEFEPAGEGTRVFWSDEGELGRSPLRRFFGLMVDRMVGPGFEAGLVKLKQKVEQPGK